MCNKSDSIWSLRIGFKRAIKYVSKTLRLNFLIGVFETIYHSKSCVLLLFTCSEEFNFSDGIYCSLHAVSTFVTVSLIYISPQQQAPWHNERVLVHAQILPDCSYNGIKYFVHAVEILPKKNFKFLQIT